MNVLGRYGGRASNDIALFAEIVRLHTAGNASVLATVIDSSGSSPRKVGARMLVREDGSILGSVGGGRVEQEVIVSALAALRDGQPRQISFRLTERYNHVCGGFMGIFLEPNAAPYRLVIAGAGHIGTALTALGNFAGFHVTVLDERPEFASFERFPEADAVISGPVVEALEGLAVNDTTAIVIATAGFEQDFGVVRAALKTPAGFIGMIGSNRKRAVLATTLAQEGFDAASAARVTIPVGLDIRAETPQEIAVSIVAQLIAFRKCRAE